MLRMAMRATCAAPSRIAIAGDSAGGGLTVARELSGELGRIRPQWKFTVYTAAGCIPWVLMLGIIGVEVGSRWEEWRDKLHYFDYVVIAVYLLAITAFGSWFARFVERGKEYATARLACVDHDSRCRP